MQIFFCEIYKNCRFFSSVISFNCKNLQIKSFFICTSSAVQKKHNKQTVRPLCVLFKLLKLSLKTWTMNVIIEVQRCLYYLLPSYPTRHTHTHTPRHIMEQTHQHKIGHRKCLNFHRNILSIRMSWFVLSRDELAWFYDSSITSTNLSLHNATHKLKEYEKCSFAYPFV